MNSFAPNPANETFVLNLGPQHPATHGVLRIKLVMDGEYIVEAEPVLGYIHRMHEKMGENRTWAQFMPNTGRMDYLHALAYNHNFACIVERAAGIEVPERAEFIRVITSELNRISSHLLWFGAFILDLGGFSPLLYAFDDREQILDLLETVTGSRLTYCYFRFGGVYNDIDENFEAGARAFITRMRERMPMYHALVTKNIILMKRLKDIGHVPAEMCRKYGATGPVARGAGIDFDVRKHEPFSIYPRFDFDIPVYHEADSMARYMVRMDEIEQSLRIIEQALGSMPEGPVMAEKVPKTLKPPKGDYYHAVETARGSFGIRAVSDGTNTPWRLKLRTPSFSNLIVFGEAARGMLLPDALALLGSLDLVIPEIDR
ncbi:NADH-quinone oxidoreductase subunit D [Fundidesulfovibrio putealis]|uniref:NADH-quinone oxidoreductase subunit D n=1 Tax=Fundidesulfovibrio putealis TaxID=270496 RepID=UPI00041CB2F5|nr:NADH-quinone oxidoreductase subunit D [Fundidesulfovibrio putealis]